MTARVRTHLRQFGVLITHAASLAAFEYFLVARALPWTGYSRLRHVGRNFVLISALDGFLLIICAASYATTRRLRTRSHFVRVVAAVLFGALTFALVSIYVANHFSLSMMGGLTDADLLAAGTTGGIEWARSHGGIPAMVLMVAAVAAICSVFIAVCWRLAKDVSTFMDDVFPLRFDALACVVFVFYGAATAGFVKSYLRPVSVFQDPIITAIRVSHLMNTSGSNDLNRQERMVYRAGHASAHRKNVIIIVADSLRADHLPMYGYPRMTAPFLTQLNLGGHLHRAEHSTSACSESVCGIFAILDSKLISHAGSSVNFTLHQLLKDQGYKVNFILSGSHSYYPALPTLYGTGFKFDDYVDGATSGKGTDDRSIINALEHMPPSDGSPNFFFIFLMSSHALGEHFVDPPPFLPTPSFNPVTLFASETAHTLTSGEQQQNINRYDNGVFQADGIIEKIFATLEQKHFLSDTVTFITGDHGEGLGERGLYAHGYYLYPEFVHVPILIYDPSNTNYRNLAFADQTDIAVTALDAIGLPKPASWEGGSLVAGATRSISFTQNDRIGQSPCRGTYLFREGRLDYLIQCEEAEGKRSEEVFDLSDDPLGIQPASVPIAPEALAEMREQMAQAFPLRRNQF
jgi:glucan phosphoethanolaminetransferase (alkaline phosphatase superfamily)